MVDPKGAQLPIPGTSSSSDPKIQAANAEYLKEMTKFVKEVGKVKKEHWTEMRGFFQDMKQFVDGGGFAGLISGSLNRMASQISNNLDAALVPAVAALNDFFDSLFDNEVIRGTMDGAINVFATGLDGITGVITGDFSAIEQRLLDHQAMMEQTHQNILSEHDKFLYEMLYGWDIDALNLSGTEGGIYSSIFDDLNYDAIESYFSDSGTFQV